VIEKSGRIYAFINIAYIGLVAQVMVQTEYCNVEPWARRQPESRYCRWHQGETDGVEQRKIWNHSNVRGRQQTT
jgi:hypothetical protein